MLRATSRIPLRRIQLQTRAYNKTALYDFHVENNAKIVEFAGYDMPLYYQGEPSDKVAGGPVKEHHQVRESAGLFDVGHMVQSFYHGPGAQKFLEKLLPAPISSLPIPSSPTDRRGSSLSALLNEKGGIIDDCIITRWGANEFYLVTNAGCAEKDLAWIKKNVEEFNSTEEDKVVFNQITDVGLIALQGPAAFKALQRVLPKDADFDLNKGLVFGTSAFVNVLPSVSAHIARGGYTGEDGFELAIPNEKITEFANRLLDQPEVKLTGLACRDSLRLEAGMCLYGHDLDENTGIGEASLNWIVDKSRKNFIGAERTFAELKKGGCTRKRVGLTVTGAPAREGTEIFSLDGQKIGVITSGLPSPTLKQNIAMAYITTEGGLNKRGTQVQVQVRGKFRPATVVAMPFAPTNYFRG